MNKTGFLPGFRSALALSLAAARVLSAALPVYGAPGPGRQVVAIPEGVGEEQWNRLNDNTIEFDELSGLIRYFNPGVRNITASIQDALDSQQYILKEMKGYVRDLEEQAQEMQDSGATQSSEGMEQYLILTMMAGTMKSSAEKMGKALEYMARPNSSLNSNIDQAVKTYSYYASQIMTGYNMALANRKFLEKVEELCLAASESAKRSYELGLTTETAVLSAEKELLSARASLYGLDSTLDGLRRSLYQMTGYPADGNAQIGGLPQIDPEAISSLDLSVDRAKAIGNNYSLIALRHSASDGSTTGTKGKEAVVSEVEQTLAVTMEALYQSVLQGKAAYEAAGISYEKALLNKGKADRSYELGMIGKIPYLQTQMAFLQAQCAKENAYSALYQAYDTYLRAVDGIIM